MDRSSQRIGWTMGIAIALCALAGTLSGCGKPLFSPDDYRSQYDRFDAARGQYAEQYTFDAYGRRRPNLRGRLSPRE